MGEPLDLTKPLQTRDGRSVALITVVGREPYPLVGYIGTASMVTTWKRDGRTLFPWQEDLLDSDLVNVPAKIVRYLNRYRHGKFFEITEQPLSRPELTERIRIEFAEGQIDG